MSNNRFPFQENNYYHIFNRWFNKQTIFLKDSDFKVFFRYFKKYYKEYNDSLNIISYCVLWNHFHFIIQCKETGLKISEFMRKLQVAYSMYFKRSYETGLKTPVFEWRFKCLWIDSEEYLYKCQAYVNYNPLKHNIVSNILDWPYTSIHQVLDGNFIPKVHVEISWYYKNIHTLKQENIIELEI